MYLYSSLNVCFADFPFAHGAHLHQGTGLTCVAVPVQCPYSATGGHVSMDALLSFT